MKRVAALWLPNWSIDRIMRAEPTLAPPPERGRRVDLDGIAAHARAERAMQCDAPKNTGWRPGARWAKGTSDAPSRREVARQLAALPPERRPPQRELGRHSEAVAAPFRRLRGDDGGTAAAARDECAGVAKPARLGRPLVPAVRYPGDGPHPDKHGRRGSNDPHAAPPGVAAFFDTGRTMAGMVGRLCRSDAGAPPPAAAGCVLVTAHKVGPRVEVAAASPAVQTLGIAPGMALTQARAAVPQAIVRDADAAGDAAALHELAILLARRWTPVVAHDGDDGLLLDVSGVAHLHGGEARMAARLVRLLARHGVTARVAVADTAGAARALARHAADPVVLCPPGEHRAALLPLPAAALGFAATTVELLQRLGVATVETVLALPPAPFARRFGAAAARQRDRALGIAPEPLDPVVPPERIAVAQCFAEPIATADAIAHWLALLLPRLVAALAEAGQGVRTLLFVADRVDGVAQVIRIGCARPTRDAPHLLRLIARRIEEIDPGYGIDALRLIVRRADPLAPAVVGAVFDDAPDLAPLVDTLANRAARAWRMAPVESDVPERSARAVPPLDPPPRDVPALGRDDVRRLDARPRGDPWQPSWPRPARLLSRPERLDNVMAELPDRPPVRFTWRGVRHRVVRADGPERIAGEWWRRAGERDAVRDYYRVEDEAGRRYWLYRRGDGERTATGDLTWYLHGTFA